MQHAFIFLLSRVFASEHPFALPRVCVFRCAFVRQGARRATPPVSRIRKRLNLPSFVRWGGERASCEERLVRYTFQMATLGKKQEAEIGIWVR